MDEENKKNKKSPTQKAIKKLIKKVLISACIVILLAASALAIIDGVISSIKKIVGDVINAIVTPINAEEAQDLSDGINITDETANSIKEQINSLGFSLDDLYLSGNVLGLDENSEEYKKEVNKYLKEFLLAEVCSQYPDFGIQEDDTHYNGIIKVKRANSDSQVENATSMKYVRKDIFDAMVEVANGANKSVEGYESQNQVKNDIRNVFTIDNVGNLYFANDTTIANSGAETGSEYTVTTQSVNYKDTVEKYAMPIAATLSLCEITQNPQYVYEFIEKFVRGGHIDITILDSKYVDTYETWYEYTIEGETKKYTREEKTINGQNTETTQKVYGEWKESKEEPTVTQIKKDKENYKKRVTTKIEGTAQVTDVDTWMTKVNIAYENKQDDVNYPLGENGTKTEIDLKETMPDAIPNTKIEIKDDKTKVETKYTVKEAYSVENESVNHNLWERTSNEVDDVQIEEKAKNIIAQWNEKFTIPNNPGNDKKRSPGTMIKENAEMFIFLLDKDESTQKQSEIFQYLIYLYTNGKYGKAELDTSIYENNDLKVHSSSDIMVDIRKSDSKLVLSKEKIRTAVTEVYSGDIQKNLTDNVDAFYKMQSKYKVNAIFAVAMTIAESSGGTNWGAIDPSTHNWMSITGSYKGQTQKSSNGYTWRVYPSFAVAVDDFGDLIANGSPYFAGGNYTVRSIMKSYNPGGADTEANTIIKIMLQLYKTVGVDVSIFSSGGTSIEGALDGPNWSNLDAWTQKNPYAPNWIGQCTWFAWGRFYEIYGYDPGFRGNGYECAKQLVAAHGDKFELSSTPAAGAIISTIGSGRNHVAIVVGIDGDKLIVDSGNLDGRNNTFADAQSDWRRITWTLEEMCASWGPVEFAVPK